ncbi:MAG: hypothetical protein JOZ43_05585 [Acidobacteriales bacterium]|nr:hypothetical protein [Terriglobales bacterium]
MKKMNGYAALLLAASTWSYGQTSSAPIKVLKPQPKTAPQRKMTPQQQFALDTVRNAVARPVQDPQERLRVLSTAVSVANALSRPLAAKFANEGVKLEQQLINSGTEPAASMMQTGFVTCANATEFVDQLAPTKVMLAEQSLIGAVMTCPAAAQATQAKIDAGAAQGQVVPRAFMAAAEQAGLKSQWSQSRFERLMTSLPDQKDAGKDSANLAAMYDHMAPVVSKDVATKTGLSFLDWLSKVADSPERNLAVRITTDAMKKALGADAYAEALRSDVIAQQTSLISGPMDIEHPEEEAVSVTDAITSRGTDKTESLRAMPPTKRARAAAADAFAEGTNGRNRAQADKYFDIAFSALDEAWQSHAEGTNMTQAIEEVCEAAAQVDYVAALKRAERLSAPAEQAIGMLAVARVILGKQS